MLAPVLPAAEKAIQNDEIPEDMLDRWGFWKRLDEAVRAGKTVSEKLARFHASYQQSSDYRVCMLMEEGPVSLAGGL